MREVTGFVDKRGLPILDGDILQNEEGNEAVVERIEDSWLPFFFGIAQWQPSCCVVIGSIYHRTHTEPRQERLFPDGQ